MLTRAKLLLAAITMAIGLGVAQPAVEARPLPQYPSNALRWQIKVLAPIGFKPFAYYFCQDATGDKIVWLRHRHYHYFVVERCRETLDGYYRSTIAYWYVY